MSICLPTPVVANHSIPNSVAKNLPQNWEQSSYHNAISCEDEKTFRYLFNSPKVDPCSETALRQAMRSKKNVFLSAMLPLLTAEKFRQTFVLLKSKKIVFKSKKTALSEKSGQKQQRIELSARLPQRSSSSSSTSQEMVSTSPRKRPYDQQDENSDDSIAGIGRSKKDRRLTGQWCDEEDTVCHDGTQGRHARQQRNDRASCGRERR